MKILLDPKYGWKNLLESVAVKADNTEHLGIFWIVVMTFAFANNMFGTIFSIFRKYDKYIISLAYYLSEKYQDLQILEKALKFLEELRSRFIENCDFLENQMLVRELSGQNSINVTGINYEGRDRYSSKVEAGDEVFFQREPDNDFDVNAIKAKDKFGNHIGYISKHEAEKYADILDMGVLFKGVVKDRFKGTMDCEFKWV